MEIIRLSTNDLKKLNKYELNKEIHNTESDVYIYRKNQLLKLFKDSSYIYNKLYVLNKLFYIKDNLDINELVMPESLVKVSGKPAGYLMEYIKENTNIGMILNSKEINFSDKKYFFIEIAKILRKIEKNDFLKEVNFHLGDIHEYNFIYDNKNNSIKGVDIDSSYVAGASAPTSKFLTFNDKLWNFPNKYPIDIENDRHIPNKNTTIISYIYILLNVLSNMYIPNISIKKFCELLNMLNSVGVNSELLDSIYNIYLPKDNYFDYELVNTITEKQYNDFKLLQLKNVKK